MATITVAEHTALEIDLDATVAAAIHADGHLSVSPLGPGRHRLKARHRVGILRYGDLEVRIVPKVPIGRLLYLAAHGGLDDAWHDLDARLAGIDDPRSALAHVMLWHAERALRPTPLQGYRTEESSERHLRGRVLFERQIASRAGVLIPVAIRYEEYDLNTVENRVLLAALRRIEAVVDDASSLRSLGRLRRTLDGVVPWVSGQAVPEIPWTRLNARYRPAIRLARLLLDRESLEFGDGSIDGRGFLLDMPRVFESFLAATLTDALARFGGEVRAQHRTALDENDEITMYPDITWWRDRRCRAVVDAKYKWVRNDRYPNADAYQMLAYCTRLGLDTGWLIYADLSGERPVSQVIRNAGITIRVEAIDLGGSIERLEGSVRALAGRLADAAARSDIDRNGSVAMSSQLGSTSVPCLATPGTSARDGMSDSASTRRRHSGRWRRRPDTTSTCSSIRTPDHRCTSEKARAGAPAVTPRLTTKVR